MKKLFCYPRGEDVKNSGLKPQSVFEFLSTPKMPLLSVS